MPGGPAGRKTIEVRSLKLNDPDAVLLSLRKVTKSSPDQLFLHKLHCVLLVGLGRNCHEVANWFGDSTRTVERWVNAYRRFGLEGLSCHQHGGRTPCLPLDIARRVEFELGQAPGVCGFPDAHWGGRLLMEHLQTHYGITMSLRQCQRTLRCHRISKSRRSPA